VPVFKRKFFAEAGELHQIGDLLQSRPAYELPACILDDPGCDEVRITS
jgi:hypothetical protein